MDDPIDMQPLRKWIHDLNNRVGVILATSELLQLEQLSPKAMTRTRTIEQNSLEVRDILRNVADRYLNHLR
jgi:hypothetical protein